MTFCGQHNITLFGTDASTCCCSGKHFEFSCADMFFMSVFLAALHWTVSTHLAHAPAPAGQPCCSGDTPCADGQECSRVGVCPLEQCGAEGDVCCTGDRTCNNNSLACSNSTCVTCGKTGQVCCTAERECESGNMCGADGMCEVAPPEPCGGLDQQCCPGGPLLLSLIGPPLHLVDVLPQ